MSLPALPAQIAATGMSDMTISTLAQAKLRFAALAVDLSAAPDELQSLWADASSALISGDGVRAITYVAILFLIGTGAEWFYWTYALASLRLIDTLPVASPRQAFVLGLRRLALLGFGLALFTIAVLGASAGFSWPPGVHEIVVAATLMTVVLRLAWLAIAVILTPGHEMLRLLPVPPAQVPLIGACIMVLALLFAFGHFVPGLVDRLADAPHAANALRLGAGTCAAALLLAMALAHAGLTPDGL